MDSEELMPKIKNKQRRAEVYKEYLKAKKKHKLEVRKERMEMAKKLGDKAPPKQMPKTLESMRIPDETMVDPTNIEVQEDLQCDEMASYFKEESTPKILITTSKKPCKKTDRFCKELRNTIPNSFVRYRKGLALKKLIPQIIEKEFTDLIVVNEDRKMPNGLLLCHLPGGPTAEFKLMNLKLRKEIKRTGKMSDHYPEVNIHNFGTRLGVTIGRMLTCLFPHNPNYYGRRVVTFHNQRDYIFFRQHRYEFKNAEKVALQELGPRFILRLRSLQKGTFDSRYGMYEWIHKRHEMDTSRRKFHL